MKLYVDDEPLLLSVNEIQSYKRWIDFREGVLRRELVWRTPAGKLLRVATSRMVSFTHRHMALMSIEVTMLEGDAPIVISSQILNREDGMDEYHVCPEDSGNADDPRQARKFADEVLVAEKDWHSDRRMILGFHTASLPHRHRARMWQAGVPHRGDPGPTHSRRQGRGLPLLAGGTGARAVRPCPSQP